jgi:hypothetical protein
MKNLSLGCFSFALTNLMFFVPNYTKKHDSCYLDNVSCIMKINSSIDKVEEENIQANIKKYTAHPKRLSVH